MGCPGVRWLWSAVSTETLTGSRRAVLTSSGKMGSRVWGKVDPHPIIAENTL